MLNIRDKTGEQIKVVTTDGFNAYEKAVKRTFGYSLAERKYKVEHRIVTQGKGEGFNIWVERMHNSIRQRTTGFRGLHGSVESAYAIMKSIEIYYNFIKKHQAINCCPYELATDLKLTQNNKWLELIKLSKKGY